MSDSTSNIKVSCELTYEVMQPSDFVFNFCAAANDQQIVSNEVLTTQPQIPISVVQILGSQRHRLHVEPGQLVVQYSADVELRKVIDDAPSMAENTYGELPPETLPYLNPSRYCESDRLLAFAANEFGSSTPGYERVKQISDWAFEHLAYQLGTTDSSTTACDVLLSRAGVCRDFAHVGIAICRALGIPARYVSGYAVDLQPPDFHGFFEAYLGHRWFLFDPTRLAQVNGLVRIASGHDAADTPFATIVGNASLQQKTVSAVAEQLPQFDGQSSGVSTASE